MPRASEVKRDSGTTLSMNTTLKRESEVEEQIKIEIPRKYQKKITKSTQKEEKYLIFFKNTIKIFSNSRNSDVSCDKIDIIDNHRATVTTKQNVIDFLEDYINQCISDNSYISVEKYQD